MNVWLDIGIAALIVLFAFSGFRRGIVYTVLNVVSTVASMLGASLLSGLIAMPIYNGFVKDGILKALGQVVSGIPLQDPANAAQQIIEKLSNFDLNVFSLLGIDKTALADTIRKTSFDLPAAIEEILRPYATKMVSCVLTFVIFLILMVIASFLTKKLSKAVKKTMLKTHDRILGALIGVVEAVLIAMLLALIIYFVMMFISPESCRSFRESVNNTIFYRLITKISLPDMILNWLAAI